MRSSMLPNKIISRCRANQGCGRVDILQNVEYPLVCPSPCYVIPGGGYRCVSISRGGLQLFEIAASTRHPSESLLQCNAMQEIRPLYTLETRFGLRA